jgi:hypothetical protein
MKKPKRKEKHQPRRSPWLVFILKLKLIIRWPR